MNILDLDWTTLYVTDDPATSWYRALAGNPDPHFIPKDAHADLNCFREALIDRQRPTPFRMEWGERQERMRVKPLMTSRVTPLFVCRRYRVTADSLEELGWPTSMISWLLDSPLPAGLYKMIGPQESGKTTSAGALFKEYAARHGGVQFSVESPIEMMLEGRYNNGFVYQTEIDDENKMGPALRGLLQTGSTFLYGGEVTTDTAAREVQNIAGSGNRVLTTFHANDPLSGLRRFADAAGGNYDAFAEALQAVFFLTLKHHDPATKPTRSRLDDEAGVGTKVLPEREFVVSPLVMTKESRVAMLSAMRNGEFQNLISEMSRQRDLFLRGKMMR
jgi:twitching motility protein PilT